MTKVKKVLASFMAVAMVASISTIVVYAGSFGISAHTIPAGATMTYYDGNGLSVAKGGVLYLDADFAQQYQWSTGAINVTTGASSTNNSGTGRSASMAYSAPTTALYKAFIKNRSSVQMKVESGSINY